MRANLFSTLVCTILMTITFQTYANAQGIRGILKRLDALELKANNLGTLQAPNAVIQEVEVGEESEETSSSGLVVNLGVDMMSRYVWRGMDFGNSPSLQPGLSFSSGNFEFGFWGAYTFSSDAKDADENDIWVSYTHQFEDSWSVTALVTDYYFPNSGIGFSNFNNWDDKDEFDMPDPGAHFLEAGLSLTGPEEFPITISGYMNFYNDEGKNVYVELAYSTSLNGAPLDFTFGATAGSEENPDWYGTDEFAIINLGISTSKEIKVTEHYSLPVSMSYVLNPKLEMSYLVVGFSF